MSTIQTYPYYAYSNDSEVTERGSFDDVIKILLGKQNKKKALRDNLMIDSSTTSDYISFQTVITNTDVYHNTIENSNIDFICFDSSLTIHYETALSLKNKILHIFNSKSQQDAMMFIIETVSDNIREKEYNVLSYLLKNINVKEYPLGLSISILLTTFCISKKIPFRETFKEKLIDHIKQDHKDRARLLLKGIR